MQDIPINSRAPDMNLKQHRSALLAEAKGKGRNAM